MLPPDGYVTTDDGLRLFFRTLGSGSPALVIPNGTYFVDDFAALADRRRLIAYDPRNRGRSDAVTDTARLEAGILNDVADLDSIRRHFKLERIDLLGHSYVGMLVILYAMTHAAHTDLAKVQAPVLTAHGTKDRSAPYGGGKDWVSRLPHARLVTVENGGHAPWIEAPEQVVSSIKTFLDAAALD